MDPVVLRPVADADLDQLAALAAQLDTVNLPSDRATIAGIIRDSTRAFAALDAAEEAAAGPHGPAYTLVAERAGALLGTGSLIARHGTPEDPHYYLRLEEHVARSRQLGTERHRRVLRLGRDTEPWTELGGLVVSAAARGQGVGKLLVAARLLLVAMHPARFCRRLIAELLPPRRADGGNAFWDAVGRPLTGLEYYRADLLCRTEKEFIEAFFPQNELVVELLPPEAQALIGVEGPDTAPVRALLKRAGFRFLGTVDPFDAGPHDGAGIDDIAPLVRSRRVRRAARPLAGDAPLQLVGRHGDHRMLATPAMALHGEVELPDTAGIAVGEECWVMPLDW